MDARASSTYAICDAIFIIKYSNVFDFVIYFLYTLTGPHIKAILHNRYSLILSEIVIL